ncbi:MAG: HD domain-containing protein [Gemmatimonadota bacterium]|nr:HD domain-containing protein [Gemmatimonadota bacterium]
MPESLPSRAEVLALMHQYVESESLRRHMYAVEAACRAYARKYDEDEELYGLAGLIHDFDYEKRPDAHPLPGAEILRERGYPEELVHAVLAHGYPSRTNVAPETLLDRTLRACDEVTGLITAAALVRPSRSVMDLEAKSVLKKFKDRAFAAGVDRTEVTEAAEQLGVDLKEHVQFVIEAMRGVAPELGLSGE